MVMTLENTLLEKLSEWQPPPGRQELHAAGDGWIATVLAERSDVLGCLLWELNLQGDVRTKANVSAWAAAVAERVRGLMEPLKVVEIDSDRREAQLRSETPQQRHDKRLYYELRLRGNRQASLRRYQATDTGRRQQVAFAVTHEALARLVGDVVACSVTSDE
jgi:hypothetical protein